MLFRMKDEKAHQLEAELDKLQADGPAAWAKLPEEELFTPAGFSEERAEATSYSNYSYWGSTFRAFFKNRVAVLLLVALIAVVAFAFLQRGLALGGVFGHGVAPRADLRDEQIVLFARVGIGGDHGIERGVIHREHHGGKPQHALLRRPLLRRFMRGHVGDAESHG